MARRVTDRDLQAIINAAGKPRGATAHQIVAALGSSVPLRTVQYRLKLLARTGRLLKRSNGPAARYVLPELDAPKVLAGEAHIEDQGSHFVLASKKGAAIRE